MNNTNTNETRRSHHQIPVSKLYGFRKEFDRLSKKAVKLGFTAPTLEVGTTEVVQRVETDPSGHDIKRWVEVVNVVVESAPFLVDGWTLAAVATPLTDAGDCILTVAPGIEMAIPEKYRKANPDHCDHCGFVRRRSEMFLLVQGDEWMQVGRTCLKDFCGGHDPRILAVEAEFLRLYEGGGEGDDDDYGSGQKASYPVKTYLAYVAAAIDQSGWLSRKGAEEQSMRLGGQPVMSTSDEAFYAMVESGKEGWRKYQPTKVHFEAATDLLTWAADHFEANPPKGEYGYNLSVAIGTEWLHKRTMGLLASLYNYRERQVAREAEARQKALETVSVHLGAKKQRRPFRVRLDFATTFEGFYGTTTLYKFVTLEGYGIPEGAILTWFSSRPLHKEDPNGIIVVDDVRYGRIQQGDEMVIIATIKDHSEYKGVKQTVINRGKVVTDKEAEKAFRKVA